MDCIFCKIVKREAPADIIYEDEDVMAFYGLHFSAPVHALVIPKKHIENILAITAEDAKVIYKVHKPLKEVADILGISH